ncbi:ABC transporter permease subunit [Actinophytocola oryzae]|uniref:Branched-chain amino acid transport system permease protein n=1 Tax=Actinophytocola oryzae TaxID=502181 RepID=A0A4R7VKV2_9PSEU|nr:ABC transporter permease [Actinophytocola oryzae]TDV49838.1 branched-chain amino acid transport system permease protein [Actinophytocola oryzae]
MELFLTFGIVGLSTAAVYAVIGSGLVLTYTTTGVFNFGHGAAGMLAAFTYWQLTVGWGWPVPPALVVVLGVLAPAFGLFVERVVLRPVQDLGEAERLVMTVALLSGSIALARWVWDPNEPRPLPAFFADRPPLRIGPAVVTWHQATTMVVAVVVAAGLWVLLYRTRPGAEMRATVDDRALAGLTGADPLRANRFAWILGTQLAAVGGILIAPTVALDASQLSLLIVSAYTAAVFGRLRSLPLTFVGAVVVGCMESYLTGYLPQNPYLPGLRLAAPALLLILALLVFPHGRLRGRDRRLVRVPLPTMRGTWVFAGVVVLFGMVMATVLGEADLITYGPIFSLGVVALSFVPLAGYAGQISLCQLSMAGIGAVVWGHLGAHGNPAALLGAVAVAGLVGALVAVPALRLSGVYLALGTAAFAVVLDRWVFTLPSFDLWGIRIALFDQGSVAMNGPWLFGWHLDSGQELMVLAALCLALASLGVAALRRGRAGRRLIALRDSEAAYATLGGKPLTARVAVFALSAGIAGLGGALYGMQQRSITAEQFTFVAGLPLFLVAVIGGLGAVGTGLFTGTAYVWPLNALVVVAPWTQNLVALLPSLAGIGLGRDPDGIVTRFRRQWAPLGRDRAALTALAAGLAALWLLRLTDVIGGWALFLGALALALVTRAWADARGRAEPEVPVEWWGVRRPWQARDEEVMDRVIAGG